MSEPGIGIIEIGNLPETCDWKEFFTLFSSYGKVIKLYLDPAGNFGKVYFDNIENAYKVQRELNCTPPLNITVSKPMGHDYKRGTKSSNNFSGNNLFESSGCSSLSPSSMNNYESYARNYDVDTTPTHQYVDVFGRLVSTLETDSGEVFISLDELKKSGFELFQAGALPRRGQRYDDQIIEQFEYYLKMKATKFMSRNQLSIPEDKISKIIETEKKEYFDGLQNRVVQMDHNKSGLLTITAPGNSPNQSTPLAKARIMQQPRGRASLPEDDKQMQGYRSRSSNRNENDHPRNNSCNRDRNNYYSRDNHDSNHHTPPQMRRPYSKDSSSNNVNRRSVSQVDVPKPLTRVALNMNTSQKEDNGTYIVEKPETPKSALRRAEPAKPLNVSFEKNVSFEEKEIPKTPSPASPLSNAQLQKPALIDTTTKPSPKSPISTTTTTKPSPKSPISSTTTTKPSPKSPISSTTVSILPQRKAVVAEPSDCGIFECIEVLNETTFIGFAMPQSYNDEITLLESIADECKADPSFKPKIGDLVAAPKDGEYVRGIVINNINGKYTCALIDYGVVLTVDEVRPLPEQFRNIPDFACECSTEPAILKDLTDPKPDNIILTIKLPYILNLSFNGKEYVIKSSPWDPFKTSPLAVQRVAEEKQVTFKNRPNGRKLKENDVVIIAAEQKGCLLIRTKECNILLKVVNQELSGFRGEPFKEQPEVGQLAVCPYNDDNLYRVLIVSINGTNAMVEYIDYGDCDTVALKDLQNINETLATTDNTLIKISLKDFVGAKFSVKALTLLAGCSERKEKFTVSGTNAENVYELILADKTNLSEKLAALDKPPSVKPPARTVTPPTAVKTVTPAKPVETPSKPVEKPSVVTIDGLRISSLPKGNSSVMCLYAGSLTEGSATFCLANAETSEKLGNLSTKIADYVAKDNKPYDPEQFEVCLAKFEEEWYRAAVIDKAPNKYGMYYIDYGNSHTITAKDIRKLPAELAEIECLAVFCSLDGVTKGDSDAVKEPLLSRLMADVIEYQSYEINVMEEQLDPKCYHITIPSLYENWKKDGLI